MISDIINQNISSTQETQFMPDNLLKNPEYTEQNSSYPSTTDNSLEKIIMQQNTNIMESVTKETSDKVLNFLVDELNLYKKLNMELTTKNAELEEKLNKNTSVELLLKLKENLINKQQSINDTIEKLEPEINSNTLTNLSIQQDKELLTEQQDENSFQQLKPKKRPSVFGRRF